MQEGLVLGIDDAEIARQSQLGLVELQSVLHQLRLRRRKRRLRLDNGQIVRCSCAELVITLLELLGREFDIAASNFYQLDCCLYVEKTIAQLLIDLLFQVVEALCELVERSARDPRIATKAGFLEDGMLSVPTASNVP